MATVNPVGYKANYSGLSAYDRPREGYAGNVLLDTLDAYKKQKESDSIQRYRAQQQEKLAQDMALKESQQKSAINKMNEIGRAKRAEGFSQSPEYTNINQDAYGVKDTTSDAYKRYMEGYQPRTKQDTTIKDVERYIQDQRYKVEDTQEASRQSLNRDKLVEQNRANLISEGYRGNELEQKVREYRTKALQTSRQLDQSDRKQDFEETRFKEESKPYSINGVQYVDRLDTAGKTMETVPYYDIKSSEGRAKKLLQTRKNEIGSTLFKSQYKQATGNDYVNSDSNNQVVKALAEYTGGDTAKMKEELDKAGGDLNIMKQNINSYMTGKGKQGIDVKGTPIKVGSPYNNTIGANVTVTGQDNEGNTKFSAAKDYPVSKKGEIFADEGFKKMLDDADKTFGVDQRTASKIADFLTDAGLSIEDIKKTMTSNTRVKSGVMESWFGDDTASLSDLDFDIRGKSASLALLAELHKNNMIKINPNTRGQSGMYGFEIDKGSYDSLASAAKDYKENGQLTKGQPYSGKRGMF